MLFIYSTNGSKYLTSNIYKPRIVETHTMEAKYYNEPPRSSKEEDELGRSVKKFKESSGVKQVTPPWNTISYKDSLIGDIPRAFQQAFKLDNV